MLRRAFLISSVMGAVSAAAALAFAPDLSRVGQAVSSFAPWRTSGSTRAPSRDPMHRVAPSLTGDVPDSLKGEYCPFPSAAGNTGNHAIDSTELTVTPGSSDLIFEGQSHVVKPDSAAICAGIPASAP
jgi:hypothetical protein